METIYKTEDVASGKLEFYFNYDPDIASISDFEILNIGEFSKGYDNENNLDIASYPDNIELLIDAFDGDNYNAFKELYKNYNLSYPSNAESVFYLTIKLNGAYKFSGGVYSLSSDKNSYELKLSFVDGINVLKNYSLGDPAILTYLYNSGIMPRFQFGEHYAYGFGLLTYLEIDNESDSFRVGNIEVGDRAVNVRTLLTFLFKLLKSDIQLDFQNEFTFRDILTGSQSVTIDLVHITRLLSSILGRYVALKKTANFPNPHIAYKNGNPEYTKPQYFKKVYEDDNYNVYYHDFSGYVNSFGSKYERGVNERTIANVLKILAKNFFSYFGFKNSNTVFFRHRRFKSSATTLTADQITSMNKELTIDKVQGVRVGDYFNSDIIGIMGKNYETDNEISYYIPLNAFKTANSYEYRLGYFQGNTEKRVIYFKDLELDYEGYPAQVIANAEWDAYKDFRDKYSIELNGVGYDFDETYKVDYENYQGTFRVITLKENFLTNTTTITALELEEPVYSV